MIEERQWKKGSFTVNFHFSNGIAHFEGFSMETVVSVKLGLKYRVLVKHPIDGKFWTMKGMENPMIQDEIEKVLKEHHKGFLSAKEFAFEVFDKTGTRKLFATRFDAEDKIPPEGYGNEHLVVQSFSWLFDLPEDLQSAAKQAIEEHFARVPNFSQ